jgi:hypothetical protein
MNTTIIYGFCWTMTLCVARVITTGETQRILTILVVCSAIALILTTLIDLSGRRARDTARTKYIARYGEDSWSTQH